MESFIAPGTKEVEESRLKKDQRPNSWTYWDKSLEFSSLLFTVTSANGL
jgi:hypothetical protein